MDTSKFEQAGWNVRCGWGPDALRLLAPQVDVVVIVDVLSFSTTVDVALSRGVIVFPYRWHDGTEHEFASQIGATVASRRGEPGLTLSPAALIDAQRGTRLVLPSPNGATLTQGALEMGAKRVLVGCLRNASAVAKAIEVEETVAVIAAGERWGGATGPLRPAIEDQLGAGAIITALGREGCSPEAVVAQAPFVAGLDISRIVSGSGSGQELSDAGFGEDVELAVQMDCSEMVPELQGIQILDSGPTATMAPSQP